MPHLTEEEKDYLDDKFEEFTLDIFRKIKLPAIGLAVILAGLVSVFAIYVYMQARLNIVQAEITFYRGMQDADKEIRTLINKFNTLAEEAERSVARMNTVEKEIENKVDFTPIKPPIMPQPPEPRKSDTVIQKFFRISPDIQQQLK